MTTILAVQGSDYVVVGADSQISSFDDGGYATEVNLLPPDQSKVRIAGKYLLAVAGDVRAINLVQHAFKPPKVAKTVTGAKLDRFITTEFVPELRRTLETAGYALHRDEGKASAGTEATVLVAINGVVFVVDSDFGWTRNSSGLFGIGTGSSFGLGALTMGLDGGRVTDSEAVRQVKRALKVAGKYDPYTGGATRIFLQRKP